MYPFEYLDSFKRLSEDKLPDKNRFYRSLKNKLISEKDYLNAVKMKNAGDYQDLI